MEEAATARAVESRAGLGESVLRAVDTGEAQKEATPSFAEALGRKTTFGAAPTPDEARKEWEEKIPAFAASAALVPGLLANPVAALKAAGWGLAGSVAGGEAGRVVGGIAEDVGLPKGTKQALTTGGALVGSLLGGYKGPDVVRALARVSPHSRLGAVVRALLSETPTTAGGGAVPSAVATKAGPTAVIADEAEVLAEQLAKQIGVSKDVAKEMVRRGLAAEAASTRATGPVVPPRSTAATATALETAPMTESAATTADEIAGQILRWKNENKWSGAQIESALRNVYGISPKDGRRMIKVVLEGQKVSPLQAERIEIGAQNVGRALGMTKEEVRKQAGPVLGEELGEASPILPRKALQSIIDTMRALPMSEREAYVARATSGKAQWQIENIRRTLEHLGLLLPAGVVAGAVAANER